MKFGDFLNTLASKLGAQNDPALVSLLSNSSIANFEVADDLANKMDTGLLSLEGAKNNRDVLNHFKPIILKAADDKFAILATKYGLESDFANEKSTYNKIDLLEAKLAAKIAEAEAKAAQAGGNKSEEVTKLNQQLAALQKQLTDTTAAKDKEIATLKADGIKQQLDMMIGYELSGKQYANKDLGDTNITIARALLDKALQEQKITLVNENGVVRMKQKENPTLDVLDSGNKPMLFSEFTNKLLADKRMLAVSGGGGGHQQKPGAFTPPESKIDTSNFNAAVASSMADLGE